VIHKFNPQRKRESGENLKRFRVFLHKVHNSIPILEVELAIIHLVVHLPHAEVRVDSADDVDDCVHGKAGGLRGDHTNRLVVGGLESEETLPLVDGGNAADEMDVPTNVFVEKSGIDTRGGELGLAHASSFVANSKQTKTLP
jgi:hypothetical protein